MTHLYLAGLVESAAALSLIHQIFASLFNVLSFYGAAGR